MSSEYRDRNRYPNPFHFAVGYLSSNLTNRFTATDWISDASPALNWDMEDYFVDTDSFTAPYFWQQPGEITDPVVDTTTNAFTVTIDPRGNASAPDPVTNQYTNCIFHYENGTTTFDELITSFIDDGTGFYSLTLQNSIEFVTVGSGGSISFTIQTLPLELDEVFVPNPIDILNINNAYTALFLTEYVQEELFEIESFNASSRTFVSSDYTLNSVGSIRPSKFIVTKEKFLCTYSIQSVDVVTNEITINASDNSQITASMLDHQYIFYFVDGTTGLITDAEESSGIITLTIDSDTDLSSLTVSDLLGILFFSRDNEHPLNYESSMFEDQWQCRSQVHVYDLELLSVQIPNKLFYGHPGGFASNYPFFFVTLLNQSSTQREDSVIYSNNPHASYDKVTFVCPNMDISSPDFASFVKFDGGGIFSAFCIKPNDKLELIIRAPDGRILQLAEDDSNSPFLPKIFNQVSALFAVTNRAAFK